MCALPVFTAPGRASTRTITTVVTIVPERQLCAAKCFTHVIPRLYPPCTGNRLREDKGLARVQKLVKGSLDFEPRPGWPQAGTLSAHPTILCPRVKDRRLSGQLSLGTKDLPSHTLPPTPHCPGSQETQVGSLASLEPHLHPPSRGPATHLFSRQAEAWRPRLSLFSRRARQGQHMAVPVLRLGRS